MDIISAGIAEVHKMNYSHEANAKLEELICQAENAKAARNQSYTGLTELKAEIEKDPVLFIFFFVVLFVGCGILIPWVAAVLSLTASSGICIRRCVLWIYPLKSCLPISPQSPVKLMINILESVECLWLHGIRAVSP
ncbi:uncharacterized protein LOC120007971 isoform X2 [Tripterygium wilfordii]|nr:uncharacterized protein LOC120007971 isoform X2 [Tripterygium wilfordii]